MATPSHWQRRGIIAILLLPLAGLFAAIASLRRLAWLHWLRPRRLRVPVVVIGNISAGGTGKTPLTLWLAQWLRSQGHHPAIVSRGYGAARSDPRPVPVDGLPADYGDEPCLLARRAGCPVWVGADRAATAQALLEAEAQTTVILCDDGLQHYRLGRDFEIAVVDGARGLGNGWPLPAGPLREPPSRLDRVDAVVVNGPEAGSGAAAIHPRALAMSLRAGRFRNLADPALSVGAAHFRDRRVHAIAGIGNPARFFTLLGTMGMDCSPHPFADHHRFSPADLAFAGDDDIVMTEKDAVKCEAFASARQWALVVDAEPDPRLGGMILARLEQPAD
jgi:tetraacyldisaccharide 4'-kinase